MGDGAMSNRDTLATLVPQATDPSTTARPSSGVNQTHIKHAVNLLAGKDRAMVI
jgi:hypothetical protein